MLNEQSFDTTVRRVAETSDLTSQQWNDAIATYCAAFAEPPYNETFSPAAARDIMQSALASGDLVVAESGGRVLALAAGRLTSRNTYYIEELAVVPSSQGRGIGRQTLDALLAFANGRNPDACEVRTSAINTRAIALYESLGFAVESQTEIVPALRRDGIPAIDERVRLSRPPVVASPQQLELLRRVVVATPGGNTTAIVLDQALNSDRLRLNRAIMERWKQIAPQQAEIEQCCFVTRARDPRAIARVEMFGGEFCGNAARAAVALLMCGTDGEGLIEVSGASQPLRFWQRGGITGVDVPLVDDNAVDVIGDAVTVRLQGITHIVVIDGSSPITPRERLRALITGDEWRNEQAVGVTYFDTATRRATFAVWVRDVDTIFDETACGSGTAAIGAALATLSGRDQAFGVMQPSGSTLSVAAAVEPTTGTPSRVAISGPVRVEYDGEMALRARGITRPSFGGIE